MTPGWCSFTVSPLRLASSKSESVSAVSEPPSFPEVGSDSVPVAPFDESLASSSANSLLLRVRGFVLSGVTSGLSATGAL